MATTDKAKNAAHQKAWRERNPRAQNEKTKQNRAKKRTRLQEYKALIGCAYCPEKHLACLEFHHIDPKQKEHLISRMVTMGVSDERLDEEIAKCLVLCSNCHRKHHWDELRKDDSAL